MVDSHVAKAVHVEGVVGLERTGAHNTVGLHFHPYDRQDGSGAAAWTSLFSPVLMRDSRLGFGKDYTRRMPSMMEQ